MNEGPLKGALKPFPNDRMGAFRAFAWRLLEHRTLWDSVSGDPYGTRTRVFAVRGREYRLGISAALSVNVLTCLGFH